MTVDPRFPRRAVPRRRFLSMLAVGAGASLLAACQSASTPAATSAPAKPAESKPAGAAPAANPAATTAPPAAAGAQPTTAPAAAGAAQTAPASNLAGATVKFGVLANYKGDAIEQELPKFTERTGIKVTVDKLPNANLIDKLTVSYAAGNPDYDLSMMDEPWIPGLSPYLVNLDEYIKKDNIDLKQYAPNALAAGVFKDQRVALPLDPNVLMVWFRKNLLDAKGVKVPTTMNEVIDAAEKLNDPANGVAGISVAGKKDGQISVVSEVLLWNEGQEIITPDGKFGFDSPAGIKALETYQRIIKSAPPGVLGYAATEQLDAFYTGKAAMVFYWASIGPTVVDPSKAKDADKMGWTSIPNAMRGIWNLGIPQGSKQKDATWELIKWMTGPEGSLQFTQNAGGHSPRYDVLQNTDFQKKYPWANDLLKALDGSKARPQIPTWTTIDNSIIDMTTAVLSGQASAADAIKTTTQQVQPYLKG